MDKRKIGRDARTGKYITVAEARRRKNTAVVETIKIPKKKEEIILDSALSYIIPLGKSAAGQRVLMWKATLKKRRTL